VANNKIYQQEGVTTSFVKTSPSLLQREAKLLFVKEGKVLLTSCPVNYECQFKLGKD
jgi:hypothetical protein